MNGGPLADAPAVLAPAPEPLAAVRVRVEHARTSNLAQCLSGEERACERGSYYEIVRPLADHAQWAAPLCRALSAARGDMRGLTLLDLETTGLRGEPLFLIGLLHVDEAGVISCRQLLSRSYDEEAAVIAACVEWLAAAEPLVTFNGESYDLPTLRGRAAAHRIRLPRIQRHEDMLLHARTRYGRTLPNCKLQTLERYICGRRREGDVPGHEIPGVYAEFVRTGDASRMAAVALHNLLDLATTADLYARMR